MTFGAGHDFTILAVAALLIGLSKGGIGGPLPTMLATLMISQRASVATAVALAVPMLMVGDAFALYTYWGTWDRKHSWALIPGGRRRRRASACSCCGGCPTGRCASASAWPGSS